LAHLALFDESIYDGGPAQLIEKRREYGIESLQPLYMDYLMQTHYAHSSNSMLEMSIECTAECDCVFIADKCALTDEHRLVEEDEHKQFTMTRWDSSRFEGPAMLPYQHVLGYHLPAIGFVDAILFLFQLDAAQNTVAPFQTLHLYFNGHCMFSATAEQLQLIPGRRDLFVMPLPPPFIEQMDASHLSMSGAALAKLGAGTWQRPTEGFSFSRVSVDFKLEGIHWFRSLTVYVQRRD